LFGSKNHGKCLILPSKSVKKSVQIHKFFIKSQIRIFRT